MAEAKTNPNEVLEVYQSLGTVAATARQLGVHRRTVQRHLANLGVRKPVAAGKRRGMVETVAEAPEEGEVRRYILTSAQNNTWVDKKVWANLVALAEHYGAELKVSRFTYNISAYTAQPAKPGTTAREIDDLWYDPLIQDYVCDDRVELAPGLVWCGEMNILPTAVRPLSGFETYTGRKSGVFPHVKIAMESIASGRHEATKFNYTTGTVTKVNYIQRKAGLKAEFHHCYGALLVEVDCRGRWFCRQLNAGEDGTICDLDVRARNGEITTGNRVEAINWGDIHEERLDETVRELAWADGGMMDALRPKFQFMHDALDFSRRNHHDRGDAHRMFEQFIAGRESIADEIAGLAHFLCMSHRTWCRTIVVDSNHDNALTRWLKEADYKKDPINAIFFLRCQLRKYEAIEEGDGDFHLLEWAAQEANAPTVVEWLRQDQSFVICNDEIECGMHGDLGPNGARGTPKGFTKMGRKANTGHTHSAGIIDGVYTAGTSSQMDMGYNKGPGSWSHSHIVTYPNGKRAVVTMWNGKWRA